MILKQKSILQMITIFRDQGFGIVLASHGTYFKKLYFHANNNYNNNNNNNIPLSPMP